MIGQSIQIIRRLLVRENKVYSSLLLQSIDHKIYNCFSDNVNAVIELINGLFT